MRMDVFMGEMPWILNLGQRPRFCTPESPLLERALGGAMGFNEAGILHWSTWNAAGWRPPGAMGFNEAGILHPDLQPDHG